MDVNRIITMLREFGLQDQLRAEHVVRRRENEWEGLVHDLQPHDSSKDVGQNGEYRPEGVGRTIWIADSDDELPPIDSEVSKGQH